MLLISNVLLGADLHAADKVFFRDDFKTLDAFKGMANSPVALNACLKLDEMIAGGSFSPVEQDIVRLTVSQYNGCTYCVAAHNGGLLSKKVSKEEILQIRKG